MEPVYPPAETWPTIEEIFGSNSLSEDLKLELARRYAAHSGEYKTQSYRNGIPINACMMKDNLQDVQEEIVDAIFNALVYRLRFPKDYAGTLLVRDLGDIWSWVQELRQENFSKGELM